MLGQSKQGCTQNREEYLLYCLLLLLLVILLYSYIIDLFPLILPIHPSLLSLKFMISFKLNVCYIFAYVSTQVCVYDMYTSVWMCMVEYRLGESVFTFLLLEKMSPLFLKLQYVIPTRRTWASRWIFYFHLLSQHGNSGTTGTHFSIWIVTYILGIWIQIVRFAQQVLLPTNPSPCLQISSEVFFIIIISLLFGACNF